MKYHLYSWWNRHSNALALMQSIRQFDWSNEISGDLRFDNEIDLINYLNKVEEVFNENDLKLVGGDNVLTIRPTKNEVCWSASQVEVKCWQRPSKAPIVNFTKPRTT